MKTATTTTSAWPVSPPNRRTSLAQKFPKTLSIKRPNTTVLSTGVAMKCSKNGSPGSGSEGSLKDVLSDMLDERVEELLNKEENRGMLEGLGDASLRAEKAKRELAEIERQEIEAKIMKDYINRLEARASVIAECQKEISEARAMVEKAEQSLTERSSDASVAYPSKVTNQDVERLESLKAAFISAAVGTLAEVPITLTHVTSSPQLILPLAITFVSCALFGITFRYAIRRDLDNFQLKCGTSAAFGFVKGLGVLGAGVPIELNASSILPSAFDCAVCVSENLLIFLFAGIAVDFCMKMRIVSPFPMDQSANEMTIS